MVSTVAMAVQKRVRRQRNAVWLWSGLLLTLPSLLATRFVAEKWPTQRSVHGGAEGAHALE